MTQPDAAGAPMRDEDLLRSFGRGSERAFAELYERYADRAFFYALNLTGSASGAEEVVQEAFMALVCNIDRLMAGAAFKAYLFAAIRSRAIDLARRAQRSREVGAGEELELFEAEDRVGEACERDEQRRLVSAALAALPPEQREVIALKIFEGMTFREIAALTGAGPNTVASRYRYGCARLEEKLTTVIRDG